MVNKCVADFTAANFRCNEAFVRRFVAALLAKRFLILTGLSGSGKTKLAQAFARWISPGSAALSDPFKPGSEIPSDRITYIVKRADHLAVEFWNDRDESRATKVLLPRSLIQEWVDYINVNKLTGETPARQIREGVGATTKYSTQLNSFETHLKAAAFASIGRPNAMMPSRCYEVVPVGADWTSSEQVLGYADGLDRTHYIRTKALDLILRALANPDLPHFLILDEMNLSHVERYFAELLSAIESGEPLHLHMDRDAEGVPTMRDGVPGELRLPCNLFVIGTVNVDETTYMFSPKVLDRANVLEFRVSGAELKDFLQNPSAVDFVKLDAAGAEYGKRFNTLAEESARLPNAEREMFEAELCLFFEALQIANAEFGFRVAKEGSLFLHFHKILSDGTWEFKEAMDAQILQKLLPKLHGSRNVLEPVLWTLATLCFAKRTWALEEDGKGFTHLKGLRTEAGKAAHMEDESLDPLGLTPEGNRSYPTDQAYYPLSFEKILRMLARLRANGFTSFAEA
jgi:energy-coupling factor transporter ATP-binding protein EcfA2